MQVCTSLQTDNHTSTPPLSFLQAGCPSCHATNSIKALKARVQWRTKIKVNSHFCYKIVLVVCCLFVVCLVSGVMYICIHRAVNLLPLCTAVSAPYCVLFSGGRQVCVTRISIQTAALAFGGTGLPAGIDKERDYFIVALCVQYISVCEINKLCSTLMSSTQL